MICSYVKGSLHGKIEWVYDNDEDLSLSNEVDLLNEAIIEKHPLVGKIERKVYRTLAIAGWAAAVVILYFGYQNYLQYVPSAEMLAFIDNSMFMPFFAPLAAPFHFFYWTSVISPFIRRMYGRVFAACSLCQ